MSSKEESQKKERIYNSVLLYFWSDLKEPIKHVPNDFVFDDHSLKTVFMGVDVSKKLSFNDRVCRSYGKYMGKSQGISVFCRVQEGVLLEQIEEVTSKLNLLLTKKSGKLREDSYRELCEKYEERFMRKLTLGEKNGEGKYEVLKWTPGVFLRSNKARVVTSTGSGSEKDFVDPTTRRSQNVGMGTGKSKSKENTPSQTPAKKVKLDSKSKSKGKSPTTSDVTVSGSEILAASEARRKRMQPYDSDNDSTQGGGMTPTASPTMRKSEKDMELSSDIRTIRTWMSATNTAIMQMNKELSEKLANQNMRIELRDNAMREMAMSMTQLNKNVNSIGEKIDALAQSEKSGSASVPNDLREIVTELRNVTVGIKILHSENAMKLAKSVSMVLRPMKFHHLNKFVDIYFGCVEVLELLLVYFKPRLNAIQINEDMYPNIVKLVMDDLFDKNASGHMVRGSDESVGNTSWYKRKMPKGLTTLISSYIMPYMREFHKDVSDAMWSLADNSHLFGRAFVTYFHNARTAWIGLIRKNVETDEQAVRFIYAQGRLIFDQNRHMIPSKIVPESFEDFVAFSSNEVFKPKRGEHPDEPEFGISDLAKVVFYDTKQVINFCHELASVLDPPRQPTFLELDEIKEVKSFNTYRLQNPARSVEEILSEVAQTDENVLKSWQDYDLKYMEEHDVAVDDIIESRKKGKKKKKDGRSGVPKKKKNQIIVKVSKVTSGSKKKKSKDEDEEMESEGSVSPGVDVSSSESENEDVSSNRSKKSEVFVRKDSMVASRSKQSSRSRSRSLTPVLDISSSEDEEERKRRNEKEEEEKKKRDEEAKKRRIEQARQLLEQEGLISFPSSQHASVPSPAPALELETEQDNEQRLRRSQRSKPKPPMLPHNDDVDIFSDSGLDTPIAAANCSSTIVKAGNSGAYSKNLKMDLGLSQCLGYTPPVSPLCQSQQDENMTAVPTKENLALLYPGHSVVTPPPSSAHESTNNRNSDDNATFVDFDMMGQRGFEEIDEAEDYRNAEFTFDYEELFKAMQSTNEVESFINNL